MIFRNRSPKGIFGQNMSDLPNGPLTDGSRSLQSAVLNISSMRVAGGIVGPLNNWRYCRRAKYVLAAEPLINVIPHAHNTASYAGLLENKNASRSVFNLLTHWLLNC